MLDRKNERTVAKLVRFTPADRDAINKAAEREGMSAEEYIRGATLAYMALTLNRHGLKAALRGALATLRDLEREGVDDFFGRKVKA